MKDIHLKRYNVLLIGSGQLGIRHLQSLAKIDIPVSLHVVDPNINQLDVAKKIFQEAPQHADMRRARFYADLPDIGSDIDLCIIATTADVRSEIVRKVVNTRKVKGIILEKVLFQSLADYDEIEALLTKYQVRSWVNCPRRMYPIYQEIKEHFRLGEKLSYHVNGGDWGLACNSIHFIDQVMFFAGLDSYEVDISCLDKEIYQSKRRDFVEFGGTLRIHYSNGTELILHSSRNSNLPVVFSIMSETCHAVVFESSGRALVSGIDSTQWRETQFRIPYQSELTHMAAKEILLEGHCALAGFEESAKLHKPMIQAFLVHMERVTGQKHGRCPIT